MKSSVSVNGRQYISASRAAEITKYSRDYIGQLCRGGKIPATMILRSWFVDLDALSGYKLLTEKNLRAYSQNSIAPSSAIAAVSAPQALPAQMLKGQAPGGYAYSSDERPLLPALEKKGVQARMPSPIWTAASAKAPIPSAWSARSRELAFTAFFVLSGALLASAAYPNETWKLASDAASSVGQSVEAFAERLGSIPPAAGVARTNINEASVGSWLSSAGHSMILAIRHLLGIGDENGSPDAVARILAPQATSSIVYVYRPISSKADASAPARPIAPPASSAPSSSIVYVTRSGSSGASEGRVSALETTVSHLVDQIASLQNYQTDQSAYITQAVGQSISNAFRGFGGGGGTTVINNTASGSVTSIDASGGTTGLSFAGGPVTSSGTLTLGGTLGVANGGTAISTAPAYGQVLLGNSSGGYTLAATSTLGLGGSSGTVSSVNASGGTTGLTFSGGPVTSTGVLTLGGTLAVANGGTGWGSVQSGAVLYGNGTSALATTSAGTPGQVLALLNGVPTWTSTTTAGTGLAYSGGAFSVNTTQNIAKLSNLTTNGFVKTTGGDGTLTVDTSTYLTGNQTVTLTGDVTGSGATSIATTYNNSVPVNKGGTGATAVGASSTAALSDGTKLVYYKLSPNNFTTPNISQWTNDAGYVTSSGVTSIATNNGLTGGTITTSGTIGLDLTGIAANNTILTWNGSRLTATGTNSLAADRFIATSSVASVFPFASTTALTVANAFYGANLTNCTTGNKLIWSNGQFGCDIDMTGGGTGGGTWSTTTSNVAGQNVNYSNNSTDIVTIGTNSTTSAKFFFDPNAQLAYISGSLGVGTTSPSRALSVQGSGLFSGNLSVAGFTATGTVSFAGITGSTQCLQVNSSGVVSGSGSACGSGSGNSFAYPFALAGNATSTLTQFNGGLTAYASSTIGNGTRSGGLTINGAATTTGIAYFAGTVGIKTFNPLGVFEVSGNDYSYFSSNVAGIVPANQQGLAIGWNKSSAEGESSIVFNTSLGSNPRLSIASYDGTTYKDQLGIYKFSPGGNTGTWIDLPTTGPSGIGTGGPGINPWIAYAQITGQYFSDSLGGDVNYRNATGNKILIGIDNGSGTAHSVAAVTAAGFGIGTTSPYRQLSVGNSAVFGDNVMAATFTATSTATSTFAGGIDAARVCITGTTKCLDTINKGTVTSIATNNGLTGGTITTSGTIGLDLSALPVSNTSLTWNGSQLTATGTVSLSAHHFIATTTTASTFPYASTTNITSTLASTTNLTISGVSGSTQCLRVNPQGIVSGAGADCGSGGSSTSPWATTTSTVAGQATVAPLNTTDIVTIGTNSTTSAKFFFDPNAQVGYISGKLGINTATPSEKLDVAGNINISTGSSYKYNNVALANGITVLGDYFFGNAGNLSMTGLNNVGIGSSALRLNTSGAQNVGIGTNALSVNDSGASNVAVGYQALLNSDATGDTAIGSGALQGNSSGANNTALGLGAGNASTGSNNVFIGASTGQNLTSGSNNIVLGYNINTPSASSGNTLNIGNLVFGTSIDGTGSTLSSGSIGLGTTTPSQRLSVQGNGLFSGNISAANITATGTLTVSGSTGTSTFGSNVAITGRLSVIQSGTNAVLIGDTTGNPRGSSAFDAQSGRTGATHVASGNTSAAVGYDNTASGFLAIALGVGNSATGFNSIASGYTNTTSNTNSIGLGLQNTANGNSSVAVGYVNTANGNTSSAFGINNMTKNDSASAFGYINLVSAANSSGIGYQNTVSGTSSSAFGYLNAASASNTLAFGQGLTVSAEGASAFGSFITNGIASSTQIGPSDAAKLTILSSGNLGVGTTSPSRALSVQGSGLFSGNLAAANLTATGTSYLVGNVGIGASSPAAKLEVAGNELISNSGALQFGGTSSSFELLKHDTTVGNHLALKAADNSSYGELDAAGLSIMNASNQRVLFFHYAFGLTMAADQLVQWSNSTTDAHNGGQRDLGFGRNAAGVAEINNGTAGQYRDLILRNLTLNGITGSTQCLQVNSSGVVSGSGSACGSGSGNSFAYPFALAGNATSTLTQFNGGLTAYASSTIGNGLAAGGLTINGNATTTGSFISLGTATSSFAGDLTIGDNTDSDSPVQLGIDANAWLLGYKQSDKSFRIASSSIDLGSNSAFSIFKGGNIGIGATTSPAKQLSLTGNIYVGGSGTSTIENNLDVLGTSHAKLQYVGDLIFANDFRFLEAPSSSTPQALNLQNQSGVAIASFDEKGNLAITGDICSKNTQCVGSSLDSMRQALGTLASSTMGRITSAEATTTLTIQGINNLVSINAGSIAALSARMDALASSTGQTPSPAISTTTIQGIAADAASSTFAEQASSTSFIQRIASAVQEMIQSAGEWVVAKLSAKVVYADRIEAQVAAVSKGFEMTDQATGSIWCVTITNGDWNKMLGVCPPAGGAQLEPQAPQQPAPTPAPTPVPPPAPAPDPSASSTPPVTATTTPPTQQAPTSPEASSTPPAPVAQPAPDSNPAPEAAPETPAAP